MKIIVITLIVIGVLLTALIFLYELFFGGPIDRCLDKGGRWEYSNSTCEGARY
jgi:hypothetical protein